MMPPHERQALPDQAESAYKKALQIKPDSGGTQGGGIDLNKLSPREQIKAGLAKQK